MVWRCFGDRRLTLDSVRCIGIAFEDVFVVRLSLSQCEQHGWAVCGDVSPAFLNMDCIREKYRGWAHPELVLSNSVTAGYGMLMGCFQEQEVKTEDLIFLSDVKSKI